MPELPEVQTVVNDLNRKIVGRRILDVWYDWPKHIKEPGAKKFAVEIKGLKIKRVRRRGKNILIYLTSKSKKDYLLLIHLKMTGNLLVISSQRKFPLKDSKHLHILWLLDKGRCLSLYDVRKFAKVVFGEAGKIERSELCHLGPEPLDKTFTSNELANILQSQGRTIKQVLMDAQVISGIGNIYSDEILWASKIHPQKRAYLLKPAEVKALFGAIRRIFKKALRLRGASISDFRDTAGRPGGYGKRLLVYGRPGEPCLHCQRILKKVKIGGRSAHFCPRCQKL